MAIDSELTLMGDLLDNGFTLWVVFFLIVVFFFLTDCQKVSMSLFAVHIYFCKWLRKVTMYPLFTRCLGVSTPHSLIIITLTTCTDDAPRLTLAANDSNLLGCWMTKKVAGDIGWYHWPNMAMTLYGQWCHPGFLLHFVYKRKQGRETSFSSNFLFFLNVTYTVVHPTGELPHLQV